MCRLSIELRNHSLRVLTLLSEGESNTTITRYCKCDGRLSGVVADLDLDTQGLNRCDQVVCAGLGDERQHDVVAASPVDLGFGLIRQSFSQPIPLSSPSKL